VDPATGDYELLDAGDGRRLERFGRLVLDRPAPGVAAMPRRRPAAWSIAAARFERAEAAAAGTWVPSEQVRAPWSIAIDGLRLELRATPAGQVGLFPEHLAVARWAAAGTERCARTAGRPPEVLNLFAYTGLVTLMLATAGARVAHVDASRPAVAWARRNAELSELADRPIRWLVEDAARFVAREARRGRRYDGVVLDPPTYGHGPGRGAWRLAADLEELLAGVGSLLADGPWFVACTVHATGADPAAVERAVREGVDRPVRTDVRSLELEASSGARLPAGFAVLAMPPTGETPP
jgi:23S rRNA (cytosine1962-C5)-methyltransferase